MIRIGCGAGFSSDRLSPAIDLARDGELDALVFECIGERTLAFGHRDRRADPNRGYTPQLHARMDGVLKLCFDRKTRIVTNMGVANVPAALDVVLDVARRAGLVGLRVAGLEGDDVTHLITPDTVLVDHGGRTVRDVGLPVIGANAYLGTEQILPAFAEDPHVIVTGRVADPSLFLSVLVQRYGWQLDDWARLGAGTLTGHLMECGMQITGGYFADPGAKDVARLAECGYPIALVDANGDTTITKLRQSGGEVSLRTVKEQLLYEVHNPASYLTPDVVADFSSVNIKQVAADQVRLSGGTGRIRPRTLKVTVGFDGGFLGEAGISYAGAKALARAALARDILIERFAKLALGPDLRIDLIGINSLHATADPAPAQPAHEPSDIRVRVAFRSTVRADVEMMLWEVEALLCCGPSAGGGYRGQISPSVVTHSALIDRDLISPRVIVRTS
jgi:Acyclic terpene utilisation family protein AtuA